MLFRKKRRAWFWYALGSLVVGLLMFGVAALFHATVSREPKVRVRGKGGAGRMGREGLEKVINWLLRSAD